MIKYFVYIALLALAMLVAYSEGLFKKKSAPYITLGALCLALGARLAVTSFPGFAADPGPEEAMAYFTASGGFAGLRTSAPPYSVPVQYFMALFSYAGNDAGSYFRYLCAFFEIVTAWALSRVVQSMTVRSEPRLAAFLGTLMLPSGVLLGSGLACAYSFGGAFFLLALAAALNKEPKWTAALFALAAAFQPYYLVLLPVCWVLPALRRTPWRSLFLMAGTYLLAMLPALLLGRPGYMTIPFFPNIPTLLSSPTFRGAPGLYSLGANAPAAPVGILACLLAVGLTYWRLSRRKKLGERKGQLNAIAYAALCAAALLPWMPVGSLFVCELLLLALCCVHPGHILPFLPVLFASTLSTVCAVWTERAPLPLYWASGALFLSIVLMLLSLAFGKKRKAAAE